MPVAKEPKKLTKRVVDALKPGAREYFVWDAELKGFGVRVKPTGRKAWLIQYRTEGGRTRRLTLKEPLTAAKARARAKIELGRVACGADPSAERKEARRRKRIGETLAELAESWLEHAGQAEELETEDDLGIRAKKRRRHGHKTERGRREAARIVRRHIIPKLGRLSVADVTLEQVEAFHRDLGSTPIEANRALGRLSAIMSFAERTGLRPVGSNPCRHVDRYEETKRRRYLSAAELQRLGQTLAICEEEGPESPAVVTAIRLLALTGARMSEILTLRWEWVDWKSRLLRLPVSKTGEKDIALGPAALEVLQTARSHAEEDNPYVIPGGKKGHHLVDLERPWRRIRERAALADVRLHDLRHTYASVAVSGGYSIPIVADLLGHREMRTTERYSHLADSPVKEAAKRVSDEIAAALAGTHEGEVVPIDRGRHE